MKKNLALVAPFVFILLTVIPAPLKAETTTPATAFLAAQPDAALAVAVPQNVPQYILETLNLHVTAYTSLADETDDTPFITASGMTVRDGIVATNLLPFGTKVKIPALFGDKVFVVEDRMAKRMTNGIDIWMSTKTKALDFGVANATVIVVGAPSPTTFPLL